MSNTNNKQTTTITTRRGTQLATIKLIKKSNLIIK